MSRKQKLPFFALYYDKLLLALSVVLFAAAVAALRSGTSSAGESAEGLQRRIRSFQPAHPGAERLSQSEFDAALREATDPFVLGTNSPLLVAAERVACIKCSMPIPMSDDTCRYCGAEQPSENVGDDWDTDGDGIPDVWEKKVSLNPLDPLDAALDADADGFTNLEEFQQGTDPRDPKSHPARFRFLRVSEIEATPFPYLLRGKSKQPDGSYKFQVNDASGKSNYLRKGDKLPGTDFTLSEYETRRELVARKGFKPTEQDVFYLTFRRGEDFVELKENGPAQSSAFEVTLICTKDRTGASWHVKRLESFEMDGERFTLVSVNAAKSSAVLKREKTGEEVQVPAK